jgi:hypothetical protein
MAHITRLALDEGRSGAAIQRELSFMHARGELPKTEHVPDVRTVQRIIKEDLGIGAPPPSWSPTGSGGGSRQLLDTLALVIQRTEGRIRSLSVAEAECFTRLEPLTAGMSPLKLWRLARLYVARAVLKKTVDDLDAYLAFAPWRNIRAAVTYQDAVDAGWVPQIPAEFLAILNLGDAAEADPYTEPDAEFVQWRDERRRRLGGPTVVVEATADPGDIPDSPEQQDTVSNAVSSSVRSATVRHRPNRPAIQTNQEGTNPDE